MVSKSQRRKSTKKSRKRKGAAAKSRRAKASRKHHCKHGYLKRPVRMKSGRLRLCKKTKMGGRKGDIRRSGRRAFKKSSKRRKKSKKRSRKRIPAGMRKKLLGCKIRLTSGKRRKPKTLAALKKSLKKCLKKKSKKKRKKSKKKSRKRKKSKGKRKKSKRKAKKKSKKSKMSYPICDSRKKISCRGLKAALYRARTVANTRGVNKASKTMARAVIKKVTAHLKKMKKQCDGVSVKGWNPSKYRSRLPPRCFAPNLGKKR